MYKKYKQSNDNKTMINLISKNRMNEPEWAKYLMKINSILEHVYRKNLSTTRPIDTKTKNTIKCWIRL